MSNLIFKSTEFGDGRHFWGRMYIRLIDGKFQVSLFSTAGKEEPQGVFKTVGEAAEFTHAFIQDWVRCDAEYQADAAEAFERGGGLDA